jgi:hypothetical protein
MMAGEKKILVANLSLKGCPECNVLEKRDPDQSIEEKYFKGWENPLTAPPWWGMPSMFRVVKENGREVLDHMDKSDRCIVTGDPLWQDYIVEAGVRQMLPTSTPNADDEHNIIGRTGIMFRYQTLRHYYFYCLEGYDKLVLYRREDEAWTVLDYLYMNIDRSRYYKMRVECVGDRLRCYLNGEKKFEAKDSTFKRGKIGIRTNTMARFDGIEVMMTERSMASFQKAKKNYETDLAELRKSYPQPVLVKKIDLTAYAPFFLKLGNLRGKGKRDFLLLHGEAIPSAKIAVPKITAIDLDGNVLWQMEYPDLKGPASAWGNFTKLRDMDGDGIDEIVCITPEKLVIISGRTGRLRAEADLPPVGPFIGTSSGSYPISRKAKIKPQNLLFSPYICNLRGGPYPRDIIIKDDHEGTGGNTCWAYDDKLNLLWTTTIDQPKFGHHQDFWDVDGDGCEEIIMGYYLLDENGDIIWRMEGAEYIEGFHGSRHVDAETMGEIDGNLDDGAEIAMAAGPEGFILVDANTGRVRRHYRVGHAQGISVGKFRPDLPGFQILIGNRWGSYGILNLFSGDGDKLLTFEPDNVSQGGPPVNWTGTGEELLFLSSTIPALGMYDGYGRRVVTFPDDRIFPRDTYYLRHGTLVADLLGDSREEIVFVCDNILYIYSQNKPYPKGEKIYAPIRKDYPSLSTPNWKINDIEWEATYCKENK